MKKKVIAFKEITFTKLAVAFLLLLFSATLVCSIVFKFTNPEIIILEELKIVATLTGTTIAAYLGKSGYEYYSRNRYSTSGINDLADYNQGLMI